MLLDIGIGSIGLGAPHKVIRTDQPLLLETFRDFADTESLGNGKADHDRVSVDQRLERITRRHSRLQRKGTALNLVLKAVQLRRPPELRLTVDDTALLQLFPDLAHAHAGPNGKVNRYTSFPRVGRRPRHGTDDKQHNQDKQQCQCRDPEYNLLLERRSLPAIDRFHRLAQPVVIQEGPYPLK